MTGRAGSAGSLAVIMSTVASVVGLGIASPTLLLGPWFVLVAWVWLLRSLSVDAGHRRVSAELPPYLDALAQRLAAGGSLAQALQETPAEPALAARLHPLHSGLSLGLGLERSISVLRARLTDDSARPAALDLLVDTLDVLVVRGGPALASLERLNDTIRSAAWVEAEVRLQAGQATASAAVLAGLPFLFAGGLAALDHRLANLYLREPIGAGCLLVAFSLSMIGWRWMTRLVRARPTRATTDIPAVTQRRAAMRSLVGTAAVAVAVAVLASPLAGIGCVVAMAAWRRFAAGRTMRADGSALAAALPEALDICTVVLGAGGSIRDCLLALSETGPDRIRLSAAQALVRNDRGHRLGQALRWLQLELGPTFQPLTGALLLAQEQGGSIGELLGRLSIEAGASRRRLGELRARQLPVALLIPLVTCSLPAVIVGAVVPLVVVAFAGIEL
ncbi:MAG: type II secretion system F family protein [Acidimicrobiales bacterium]